MLNSLLDEQVGGRFAEFEIVLKKRGRRWRWCVSTLAGEAIMQCSETRRPEARYKAYRALFLLLCGSGSVDHSFDLLRRASDAISGVRAQRSESRSTIGRLTGPSRELRENLNRQRSELEAVDNAAATTKKLVRQASSASAQAAPYRREMWLTVRQRPSRQP